MGQVRGSNRRPAAAAAGRTLKDLKISETGKRTESCSLCLPQNDPPIHTKNMTSVKGFYKTKASRISWFLLINLINVGLQ